MVCLLAEDPPLLEWLDFSSEDERCLMPEHRSPLSWTRSLGAQVHATPWPLGCWHRTGLLGSQAGWTCFVRNGFSLWAMSFLTFYIPGGHRVWLALTGAAWIPGPHSHHDTSTTSDQWLMAKYSSGDPQSTLAPACGDLTHVVQSAGSSGALNRLLGLDNSCRRSKVLEQPPHSGAHVKDETPEQPSVSLY